MSVAGTMSRGTPRGLEQGRGMHKKIRVLMAKLGLDIHWRGAVTLSRLLREAGMEVIYVGNQFPEGIVETALQENVDVVGLSTLSGNHLTLGPKVVSLLRERGMDDVIVLMGGVIPAEDFAELKDAGIDEVFGPGTPVQDVIRHIESKVGSR